MRTTHCTRPRLLTFCLPLLLLLFALPALADEPKKKEPIKLDFTDISEEELEEFKIKGDQHGPELTYVLSRVEAEDKELLELKEDLVDELLKSVKEVEAKKE